LFNLLNDIIEISKIESGVMGISISETNINESIQDIYKFFKPQVEKKEIQFSISNALPAEGSIVKTDSMKVHSILMNLVNNAIKFTSKGFIEFGCQKKDKLLEFFVNDTGLGIDPEQKEHIFERFRQGNEALTRNYEGAGLGLSISKAFVKMLGGNIWFESEIGKGSTFYFTIACNAEVVDFKPRINVIERSIGYNGLLIEQ
jgi:signal transduction histidine kinase